VAYLFCNQCGHRNPPASNFCSSCGAPLDVKNDKGWTPLTIAEGVEYTVDIFKRYPETAAVIRDLMQERGLSVAAAGR